MKEEKILKAVKYVDDDLICEMTEYSPEINTEGEVSEGVEFKAPVGRVRRSWRYPAAAAVVLGIVGGTAAAINYGGIIPDNLSAVGSSEIIETVENTENEGALTENSLSETSNSESSEQTGDAETSEDASQSTEEGISTEVSEEPERIVVKRIEQGINPSLGFFVDSHPEIPQPELSKEYFTEMTTEEALDYYGIFNNIVDLLEHNTLIEIKDENTSHGIYTLPDGSIYDINSFTFEITNDYGSFGAKRFTFTIGKETVFAQPYVDCYNKIIEDYKLLPGNKAFYDYVDDYVFLVRNKNGATLMFSGTVEEILGSERLKNNSLLAAYEKILREEGDGMTYAVEEVILTAFMCLSDMEEGIESFYPGYSISDE